MTIFKPTNILLPKTDPVKWATIACDQHTSDPSYWEAADAFVGNAPSALRVILPEVYLSADNSQAVETINATMEQYLTNGIFTEYENAMIYLERTLASGKVRRGIVGAIDLTAYDFHKGAQSPIRATEETVPERIPPRVKIRENASLELPHVMLLINDSKKNVIETIAENKDSLPLVYDFELMLGGGHVKGYLMTEEIIRKTLASLDALHKESSLLFAVGDGNHSLATAKTCYEQNPTDINRYALCEVVNIHDPSLEFEPIYRVLFNVEPDDVITELLAYCQAFDRKCQKATVVYGEKEHEIEFLSNASLTVSTLQTFIEDFLKKHPEASVDYIHGVEETRTLAKKEKTLGFLFDGMTKEELFPAVEKDGALVRKTFSMGEACDKRYYIEARKIK